MNIILWIVLGALAGWIASMIMNTDAQMGAMANVIVGILGAVLGGFIFGLFDAAPVTGFNLWSLLVAVIGSSVLLWVVSLFRRTA